jgi:magnesium transporter
VTTDERLSLALLSRHPSDAARVLERLSRADIVALCSETPATAMAPVVARMDQVQAAPVLMELALEQAAEIVAELDPPIAGLLLRRLPESTRAALLERLPRGVATRLRDVLRYGAGTAGALCDPAVTTVAVDLTVAEVVAAVREAGHAYYYVFVLDRDQRLVGVLNLRDLLVAAPDATLADLSRSDVLRIQGSAGIAAVLAHPAWQELHALPVVDPEGRFLGLLRHSTLRRLERELQTPLSQAAVGMAAEFGELLWSAGGAALGEMADAFIVPEKGAARESAG